MPFSDIIRADLREHLERFVSEDDEALVFTSPLGARMRHSNFYRRVWLPAVAKVGRPGVHFHDLRHNGTGTPTAEQSMKTNRLSQHIPAELDF